MFTRDHAGLVRASIPVREMPTTTTLGAVSLARSLPTMGGGLFGGPDPQIFLVCKNTQAERFGHA